jgi:flagellin-like protein
MNFKKLVADDDAVSPVIGVILMVAITVILAAVIGTFVLGLGDQVQSTSPQASFAFDFTDNSGSEDVLEITHDGGDSITAGSIDVAASGSLSDTSGGSSPNTGASLGWETLSSAAAGSDIGAGSTATAYGDTDNSNPDLADDTVRVTWTSESGDSSATLGKWTGPDA